MADYSIKSAIGVSCQAKLFFGQPYQKEMVREAGNGPVLGVFSLGIRSPTEELKRSAFQPIHQSQCWRGAGGRTGKRRDIASLRNQELLSKLLLQTIALTNLSMTLARIYHEIRDPIHVFISVDTAERNVIDSPPVQRLRHIHQLAMQYLVYPGATHKRFEHALGVMELASNVYDTITRSDHVLGAIREQIPELTNTDLTRNWRRVLRMAALCHDIGHLPFSHAAEHELLPDDWTHETITDALIRSPEMQQIWKAIRPPLDVDDIAKLAVGKEKLPSTTFTLWQELLSEIIVGDAFGVDRMDYLLRDSLHAGVQYGRFDHHRLVDTLRILPKSAEIVGSHEPTLGLELGGLNSAEAMLLARYAMFAQLYLHPVRRVYDKHLIEFLQGWLPNGIFPVDPEQFLQYTDVEVLAGIAKRARSGDDDLASKSARRIVRREHFKMVYSRSSSDLDFTIAPGKAIRDALSAQFGGENVIFDHYIPSSQQFDFPVLQNDNRIESSIILSQLLRDMPPLVVDRVYVDPDIRDSVEQWLGQNRNDIFKNAAI